LRLSSLSPLAVVCALALPSPDQACAQAPESLEREGHILDTGGSRVWYDVRGTGPAVLVLHGGLQHSGAMKTISDSLVESHRIITIDARGMGRSSLGVDHLSYGRQERDARAVLQQLKIQEFSIVGFSDGGTVGMRLAAHSPKQVRRLVTIGARWRAENGRHLWDVWDTMTTASWPRSMAEYHRLNPDHDFEKLLHESVTMWKDGGSDGHPDTAIADITAETLLIVGDSDPYVHVDAAADAKRRIPHAQLFVVPGAGHAAHLEKSGLVLLVIRAFLANSK
jgi:pimeloyl-ACP methyl ester carboxylesterase